MKKKKMILLPALLCCVNCFAQFGGWGGGFDFGGGGGVSSGSLSSYSNKQNIDYVGDNHVGHKLDIYYPNDGKETHNVIIHIYGSAWGNNDGKGAADHGTVGKAALDAGYIFVTPNHRTYNDALWPAQINDIKAVVRYLRGNKEELKIDDSFIGISGFSSGGHLASMMGVTNGESIVQVGSESVNIEGNLGNFTSESSAIDAVCDWSGPVDCRDKSCGNPINMSPENDMVGGCGPQQCPDKHASLGTNTYIDADDVPHMICHGYTDNIVPSCEGEKYANNLKNAGIYVEWYNPGHGHQVNGDYTDEMINFFNNIRAEKLEELETSKTILVTDKSVSLNYIDNVLTWSSSSKGSFNIIDLTGNVVKAGNVSEGMVNVSDLQPAIYIIRFVLENGVISHKFVKK